MNYFFEDSIAFMINRAVLKIKRDMSNKFKEYDITIEQWALLTRLWKNDGISQTQLSLRSGKDLPSITRMLDKLQKKELIRREVDPNDSRAYLIFLTQSGKELEDKLDYIAYEVENKSLQNIKKEDIEILKKVINSILINLDN